MKAGFEQFFLAGPKRAIPGGQDRPILPARIANQNTGIASSCPLVKPRVIKIDKDLNAMLSNSRRI